MCRAEVERLEAEQARLAGLLADCRVELERLVVAGDVVAGLVSAPPVAVVASAGGGPPAVQAPSSGSSYSPSWPRMRVRCAAGRWWRRWVRIRGWPGMASGCGTGWSTKIRSLAPRSRGGNAVRNVAKAEGPIPVRQTTAGGEPGIRLNRSEPCRARQVDRVHSPSLATRNVPVAVRAGIVTLAIPHRPRPTRRTHGGACTNVPKHRGIGRHRECTSAETFERARPHLPRVAITRIADIRASTGSGYRSTTPSSDEVSVCNGKGVTDPRRYPPFQTCRRRPRGTPRRPPLAGTGR
jgi:hypothetical protein